MAHELIHPEAPLLTPVPPRWVEELFGCSLVRRDECVGDVTIRTAGPFAHATISIRDAVHLDAPAFRNRVAAAYRALIGALESFDQHPVRFWNFVPDIGEPMLTGLDRYMVFNAGRYDAYTDWYGPRSIANGNSYLGTASAVGITGSDLLIHCLATERPGEPVENPRQRPAWQYSTRYGPLPPCFSRAMIVRLGGRRRLLTGGTASVVGEDSRHAGNLGAQVDETLLNLEALVRTARPDDRDSAVPLHCVVDLRVYVSSPAHAEYVRQSVSTRCPHARTLDLVVAQVCRRELLVEIEGVAEL